MNNILKERLSEAITSKKNDITTYVWKGKKREVNGVFVQEEKRLVDCTLDELQRNYDYCNGILLYLSQGCTKYYKVNININSNYGNTNTINIYS